MYNFKKYKFKVSTFHSRAKLFFYETKIYIHLIYMFLALNVNNANCILIGFKSLRQILPLILNGAYHTVRRAVA